MRNSVGNGHQDKCPEPSSSLHLLLHGSHSLHHMFVPSSACLCPPHSLLNERHPTVAKYIRVGLCGLASINLFETKESLLQCVGIVYVTKHNNELAMGWNISPFSGLRCHEFCVFHILYKASLNYIKHAIEKLILNAVLSLRYPMMILNPLSGRGYQYRKTLRARDQSCRCLSTRTCVRVCVCICVWRVLPLSLSFIVTIPKLGIWSIRQ